MKEIWFSLIASTYLLNHLADSVHYPIQEQIIIDFVPVCGFNVFSHYYCRDEAMDSRRGTMTGVVTESCKPEISKLLLDELVLKKNSLAKTCLSA